MVSLQLTSRRNVIYRMCQFDPYKRREEGTTHAPARARTQGSRRGVTAWVASSVAAHCQRLLDIRPKAVAASTFIAPLSIIVSFKMYYIGWRGSSLTSHHIHMGGRELGIVRRLGNCVDRGCLARERRRQREDERARLHRKSCATGRLPRRRHKLDVIATASYSPSSLSRSPRTVSWLVKFVLQ